MYSAFLRTCVLATASLSIFACGSDEPKADDLGPGCLADVDSDEDGLLDCRELELGTALHLKDTDGDGLSDFEEVVEFGFSPENNNFKFNPRIADTPHIRVQITSAPDIALLYESGTATEKAVERSVSSSQTVTTSESNTNSQAIESTETIGGSVTVGVEAGFPGGVSASAEATVSYESSTTTSSETSLTWTEEQSRENAVGAAEFEGLIQSNTVYGGSLGVTADIINDGDLAFTLTNLAISAYMTTPGLEQIISPVGGLSFDTTLSTFPQFTYAPGQSNGPFVFSNDGLDTGTTMALLENSSNLTVGVVAFELTDENGRSFTHDMTGISAKTATVIIDYGDPALGKTERYLVATNTNADTLRISARDTLTDILQLPYTLAADGPVDGIRSALTSVERDAYWLAVHKTTDGISNRIQMYSPAAANYNFNELELKSGDVLHLVFREDPDGDGLGYRQETAYATLTDNPDTDGDGIEDGEEVNITKTSPTLADTDFDCLDDHEELYSSNTSPVETNPGICNPTSGPVPIPALSRTATYSDIQLNTESSTLHFANPGDTITLSAAWNVQTPATTYCPGCIIQYYLGMRDVFSSCLSNQQFGTGTNISGTLAPTSFQAPQEPGVYYITQAESLQYNCVDLNHSADAAKAIATIVVMPAIE